MSTHTPGPWTCNPGQTSDASYEVWDVNGNYLTTSQEVHEANAARIVACINACEGVEDPARMREDATNLDAFGREIERLNGANSDLIEALEKIMAINGSTRGLPAIVQEFKHIAHAAIAKAKA